MLWSCPAVTSSCTTRSVLVETVAALAADDHRRTLSAGIAGLLGSRSFVIFSRAEPPRVPASGALVGAPAPPVVAARERPAVARRSRGASGLRPLYGAGHVGSQRHQSSEHAF